MRMYVYFTLIGVLMVAFGQNVAAQCQIVVNSVTPVNCNGNADGALNLTTLNGTATFEYSWTGPSSGNMSSADGNALLTNLPAGIYQISVTDSGGCFDEITAVVTQPPALALSTVITDATCFGSATGSINLSVSGGVAPYSYDWSNDGPEMPDNDPQDLLGISAGTYTVTVTDSHGCSNTSTATVAQSAAVVLTTAVTNLICFGAPTGAIDLTVTGGVTPYLYNWSNIPGNNDAQDIQGLPAGNYTVTVTDGQGCTKTKSTTITQPGSIATFVTETPTQCQQSTGTIDLSVWNGIPPYTYTWSVNGVPLPLFNTEDLNGIPAGLYTVAVHDASGCSTSNFAIVEQLPDFTLALNMTPSSCGQTTGALDLTVTGGTGPFGYSWNNNASSEDIVNLHGGFYIVTVTSSVGCTGIAYTHVTNSDGPVLTLVPTAVSCNGGNNGSIDLSVTGGVPPYQFLWSNGNTTQDLTGFIGPGTYHVTVIDALNCANYATATIGEPLPITLDRTVTNVSCFGGNNGAINLTVTGGTPPYLYFWSNGVPSQDVTGLVAGTYTVTVSDANGCTKTTTATVTQPPGLQSNTAVTGVSCNGGNNGFIDLNVIGGSPGYSYLWSNGNTVQDATGLPSGIYTVTITDANGCTKIANANVGQAPAINIQSVTVPAACSGVANGAIDVTVSGGTGVYTFVWSNGSNNEDILGVLAGDYSLTVTDANNCSKIQTITVPGTGSNLSISASAMATSACGISDGSLHLDLGNAVAPFSYDWSSSIFNGNGNNIATEPFDVNNLAAGIYEFTITDANGCSATAQQVIGSPMSLGVSTIGTSSCISPDGSITLDVSGANPDFSYNWENGFFTGNGSNIAASPVVISGLNGGDYDITVTNSEGCFAFVSVSVTQPAVINLNIVSTQATCFNTNNGNIDLSVSGGTLPYTYLWSNGVTTQDMNFLDAGTYTVTVNDANGCSNTATETIGAPDPLVVQLTPTAPDCVVHDNGSVHAQVIGGVSPYTYLWSNGLTTPEILNLVEGIYSVTVTDAAGCTKSENTIVFSTPVNFTFDVDETPVSGCLAADGAITITVNGGTPDFAYSWFNFDTGGSGSGNGISSAQFTISGLEIGSYSLTVTNGDGCTLPGNAGVQGGISADITVGQVACAGAANGNMVVSFTNGNTPPFSYSWSGPAGTIGSMNGIGTSPFTISGLYPGNYTVTLTNADGCSVVKTATISITSMILTTVVSNPSCSNPLGNVNIDVNNAGSAPPFDFNWSNGTNSGNGTSTTEPFDITGLTPGTYSITVTNSESCTATKTVQINNPTGTLSLSVSTIPVTCFGGANGTATVNVLSSSTPPYNFHISDGNITFDLQNDTEPFTIPDLPAGNYAMTVTDGGSCSGPSTFTVSQPNAPSFSALLTDPGCYGASSGSIDVTYSMASPPLSFSWDGPNGFFSTQTDLNNLAAGNYSLTITNAVGCTFTPATQVLTEPTLLSTVIAQAACGSNSAIALASGGTGPYGFLWNTGAVNDTIDNLNTGLYAVTVTDANNCTAVESEFIQADINLCGLIGGGVYQEIISDCQYTAEPPLAGWLVKAMGAQTYYAMTGSDGQFLLHVAPGDYTLQVVAPDPVWLPCPNTPSVSVNQPNQLYDAGALMVDQLVACPSMYVNITTGFLRRCSSNNYYQIQYCNNGSATAENAYLDVALDPFLSPLNATVPYTSLGNNLIRFNLGNVPPGDCGNISLRASVSCSAVLGQTHCTEAHIYPDTMCLAPNPNWSGASIEVRAICETDSVRFSIRNTGLNPTTNTLDYIVIEDHVMRMQGIVEDLAEGDSLLVRFPANGSTWRIEVDQETFHPGYSNPSATIEGCTTGGNFSTGYVVQYAPDDQDPWIDIDCHANIGSVDPNDKQGFPLGYGPDRYIKPGTPIEYLVRFQNTGTDTAFAVYILDTLSAWLDPATIRPGASSHPYVYDIFGTGILRFDFPGIMLADSNINEPASHGFVQFTISPRDTTPLETVIENQAAIYFDFNDPVFTNTTQHKVGINFVTSGFWSPVRPEYALIIQPNPMNNAARLEIKGLRKAGELRWVLTDQLGRVVQVRTSPTTGLLLQRENLPAGIYFLRVEQAGVLVGNGKVIAN